MNTTLRNSLLATAAILSPQMASATLIAGFYQFDKVDRFNPPYPTDVGVVESADYVIGGFDAIVTKGMITPFLVFNSPDLGYGDETGVLPGEVVPASGNLGVLGIGPNATVIEITNNTGSAYILDTLLFDIGTISQEGGSYTITGTINGVDFFTFTESLPSPINNSGFVSKSIGADLLPPANVPVILAAGDTVVFSITATTGDLVSGIDNIGLIGTAVPEPSSTLILGGLVGMTAFVRRRRA